jgi:hypothetical protein
MQVVSAAYLTAIVAPVRKVVQSVVIKFVDNRIIGTTIVVTAGEGDVDAAPKGCVVDGKTIVLAENALADPFDETDALGRARMYPADDLYPLADGIIWFGDTLSGDDRSISGGEPLILTYFSATNIYNVSWSGDEWLGRPEDFAIDYWNGSTWVSIDSVTGWASAAWSKTLVSPITTTKLRITVTKLNLPQTSAKLIEFEGGLSLDATGLVAQWEILQERSTDNMTNPLGNASSNQITLEISNIDNLFFRHGSSIYAPYLVANRRITVQCGVHLADESDELVQVGTFYTIGWDADLDSPTVRVTAWCRSKLLKEVDFAASIVYTGQTISQLVKILALDFGLLDAEMAVDDTSDVIPYAWFNKASYWSHLTALAAAEGGQVYFDELDRLVFENRSHLADHAAPVATLADTDAVIGVREGWEQSRMRNDIRVTPKALATAASQQICNLTDTLTVPASSTLVVTLFFSASPCVNVQTPAITGGAHVTVNAWTAFAWGGILTLANSAAADETVTAVTVIGQPLEESGGYEGTAEDGNLILLNGRRTYLVESRLIQSRDHAQALADGLLPALKDPGAEIGVRSRGRPELQLADTVTVNVGRMGIADNYQILRSRLVYDGGLAGELTLLEAQ